MSANIQGFIIGLLFGGGLFLSGLANPDKIIGTLRLKDFHAMRTIAVFILAGMLGVWILDVMGAAHFSVKPLTLITVLIGGGFLGIGFGMTGYCPGTGLASGAAGRWDAWIAVLGMLVGALVYILLYPTIIMKLEGIGDFGKKTLPEITPIVRSAWVPLFVIVGGAVLYCTRGKKRL